MSREVRQPSEWIDAEVSVEAPLLLDGRANNRGIFVDETGFDRCDPRVIGWHPGGSNRPWMFPLGSVLSGDSLAEN